MPPRKVFGRALHEKVGANFGLDFDVWDRLLGTNHPDCEGRFASVTAPARGLAAGDSHPAPS
jgi:sterol desaturase/sphingolipid hydroxylase (fatty acid hydroxylase superfamily)